MKPEGVSVNVTNGVAEIKFLVSFTFGLLCNYCVT